MKTAILALALGISVVCLAVGITLAEPVTYCCGEGYSGCGPSGSGCVEETGTCGDPDGLDFDRYNLLSFTTGPCREGRGTSCDPVAKVLHCEAAFYEDSGPPVGDCPGRAVCHLFNWSRGCRFVNGCNDM